MQIHPPFLYLFTDLNDKLNHMRFRLMQLSFMTFHFTDKEMQQMILLEYL